MTQYEATCSNCGSKVLHLMQSASVQRCDECKGNVKAGEAIRKARFEEWGTK